MRIVVWGINYAPEVTGIAPHNAALCEFLKSSGHEVEMLTTFPYYPAWSKATGDRGRLYRTDIVNGILVHRCWHYVPARISSWKRILHEASFIMTSMFGFFRLQRPDLIIAVSPPLLIGAAAWLAGAVRNAPFIFHVQDLQPDGAMGLGMLKPGLFVRILYGLESFAYRKARRVSGISHGMLAAFLNKGVPESRQLYFPNTIVIPKAGEMPPRGRFRARHGLGMDDFLAVHSGNVGMKHGLHTLVEAAGFLKSGRIKIIICGEGTARESLANLIAARQLKNVMLLPLQSGPEYAELLVDADVCFIAQQKGSGHAFFPSKLLNALAYSRPVVTVADPESELAKTVVAGGFGVNVSQDDPRALAEELDRISCAPEKLNVMGDAGRKFAGQFERERVFREFETAIVRAVQ